MTFSVVRNPELSGNHLKQAWPAKPAHYLSYIHAYLMKCGYNQQLCLHKLMHLHYRFYLLLVHHTTFHMSLFLFYFRRLTNMNLPKNKLKICSSIHWNYIFLQSIKKKKIALTLVLFYISKNIQNSLISVKFSIIIG